MSFSGCSVYSYIMLYSYSGRNVEIRLRIDSWWAKCASDTFLEIGWLLLGDLLEIFDHGGDSLEESVKFLDFLQSAGDFFLM